MAGRVWRGWWGEVRFNLAGTVRSDSIRYGMVGSGSAGPVGRDKVRWGVVWSGVVWQAR